MRRLFWDYTELEITGAQPELCLNRFTRADLPFRDLRRPGDFRLECRIETRRLPEAKTAAARAQCELTVLRRGGLLYRLKGLSRRPVLIPGMLLAFALALWLQNFVWFVRVEGNERIPAEAVLRALEAEGVGFGTWGPSLEVQDLKNRLLLRLPALRWLTLNREGVVLTVPVTEQDPAEAADQPPMDMDLVTDLTAAADGVILSVDVYNGFAAVSAGEAVTKGQLLVSGLRDCPTHTQATRALGEVVALTKREYTVKIPEITLKKIPTGRTERCVRVIFQRNRRKISGNSGIFGMECDKMIETIPMTLPGGHVLPWALEVTTLREYRTESCLLSAAEAEAEAAAALRALALEEMTAGTIVSETYHTEKAEGCWTVTAVFSCQEDIARTVPVPLLREDAINGENHQRGTN